MHMSHVDSLRFTTRSIDGAELSATQLLSWADADNPLYWARGDVEIVGIGELARIEVGGAGRIRTAASAWGETVERAAVDDPVKVRGTGAMAFASFAFDARSDAGSTLIVPRLVLGRTAETLWATTISAADEAPAAEPLEALALTQPTPIQPSVAVLEPSPEGEARYAERVSEAVRRIRAKELEKVVLSRTLTANLAPGFDSRSVIAKLRVRYRECHVFAVDGLVGASPETLVSTRDGEVRVRVLAGTVPREADSTADEEARDALLASHKNMSEHVLAVDSAMRTLLATGVGAAAGAQAEADAGIVNPGEGRHETTTIRDLEVSRPFPLALPNVWHLATDLSAVLGRGVSALDVAAVLHPTAAVAGTPTVAAMDAIREIERRDRGRYAAPIGWVGAADAELAIALRCASFEMAGEHPTVTATAGGGIVAESIPDEEVRETVAKFEPIRRALAGE